MAFDLCNSLGHRKHEAAFATELKLMEFPDPLLPRAGQASLAECAIFLLFHQMRGGTQSGPPGDAVVRQMRPEQVCNYPGEGIIWGTQPGWALFWKSHCDELCYYQTR